MRFSSRGEPEAQDWLKVLEMSVVLGWKLDMQTKSCGGAWSQTLGRVGLLGVSKGLGRAMPLAALSRDGEAGDM